MNWFSNLFKQKETEVVATMKKFLIVGLGNIGAEYVNTRHNIGFKALDFLAKREGFSFQTSKLGDIAEYKTKGKTIVLLKPNTYMNLSGKAVKYWMEKENIPLENVLIVADDLNIPFGTIRIRPQGSAGGHNGLKSINETLATQNYARFRFGISDAFKKGKQVDYVLGNWDEEEKTKLPERLELSSNLILSFATAGIENTMTAFNGK